MSADEPNMVDVALLAPEAGGVLSLIADQMSRDAKHRQDFQEALWVEALAEAKAAQDGVRHALLEGEWGGTTAQYERTLGLIEAAMAHARYDGPIRRWYIAEFKEDRFSKAVHPSYVVRGAP
jgi:hypothetical protein